jgi:hypothetical protein
MIALGINYSQMHDSSGRVAQVRIGFSPTESW